MVFASQGRSPRDANTIKTAIQPCNCFKLRLKEKYAHLEEDDFVLDKLMEDIPTTERFDKPVSESVILEKINDHIPRSTKNSTAWAVKLWDC